MTATRTVSTIYLEHKYTTLDGLRAMIFTYLMGVFSRLRYLVEVNGKHTCKCKWSKSASG